MKSCILVNYLANNEEKVDVVVECIKQLKKSGLKVFYSSVIPINERIQKVSDFTINNNDNPIITFEDELSIPDLKIVNTCSYKTDYNMFYFRPLNHIYIEYTLLLQIQKDIKFISSLGYTHFHFIHGDNILVDSDVETLIHLEKTCECLKKKAFFEDVPGESCYRKLYFFSEIDFFLNNSGTYTSKFDFIEKNKNIWPGLSFERYIRLRFHHLKKYTILGNLGNIIEDGAIYIFKKSKDSIGLYNNYNPSTQIALIPNGDYLSMDLYVLVINHGKYSVFKNDEIILEFNAEYDSWYMVNLPIEPFKLTIIKDDELFLDINLTEDKLNKICKGINYYV